jgi:hypothetical protein
MTESNPSSLDFTWSFPNNQGTQERTRSNGRVSKVKWTPRSENDFGTAICIASNSLDSSQCMIKLELGGDYLLKISPLFNSRRIVGFNGFFFKDHRTLQKIAITKK